MNEAEKFFPPDQLRMREWTSAEWTKDNNIRTIWIIHDSLFSRAESADIIHQILINKNAVRLMSLCVDEAHLMCRSKESNRVQIFRHIASRAAEFVVLISGIMFPLGPKQDAQGILESCGDTIDDHHVKWKASDKEIIRSLLTLRILGYSHFPPIHYPILSF